MQTHVELIKTTQVKANIMKINVTLLGQKSVLGFPLFIYLNLSEEVWWFPDCGMIYWTNDERFCLMKSKTNMKNLGTVWRKQPMSVYVKFNKMPVMFSKRDCHNQYLTIEVCPFWIAAWLLNNLTSLFRQGLRCSWKLEDPGGKTTWKFSSDLYSLASSSSHCSGRTVGERAVEINQT